MWLGNKLRAFSICAPIPLFRHEKVLSLGMFSDGSAPLKQHFPSWAVLVLEARNENAFNPNLIFALYYNAHTAL
jgi:hypothetical protein